MEYNKLNLSKLQFEIVQEPPHISVKYDNKNLVINTPKVTIPFGIDEVYDKFYTKLQFENYEHDEEVMFFMDVLKSIEERIISFANDTFGKQFEVSSEFNYRENHEPSINAKLVSYRGKPKTRIISKTNANMNYWEVAANSSVKCKMSLSGIWPVNNKFCYKWNLEEIKVI